MTGKGEDYNDDGDDDEGDCHNANWLLMLTMPIKCEILFIYLFVYVVLFVLLFLLHPFLCTSLWPVEKRVLIGTGADGQA